MVDLNFEMSVRNLDEATARLRKRWGMDWYFVPEEAAMEMIKEEARRVSTKSNGAKHATEKNKAT